jgi:glycosyltransferase involved in cell wall biosynthesis
MATPVRSVALNALFLDPGVSGGPETYLRELVPPLVSAHPSTRFSVVTTRKGGAALRVAGWEEIVDIDVLPVDNFQTVRKAIAEQLLLPALVRRKRWDIVHSLTAIAPIYSQTRAVITLHDVIFFEHRTFGLATTIGMRQVTARAARRASALITGAAAARDEICAVLGIDPGLFTVVPHGVGRPPAVDPAPERDVRSRYGLGDARVVVCVAAKRPHKNQEVLVRALSELPEDVVLVLAGHPEPYEQRLRRLASALELDERVRFVGYVSDRELEALWRLARCAAFPTLAEGFGLPVLEAMARGVPIACSEIAVLREVCGDAVRYFDPHDPADAAAAIDAVLADGALRERGRQRSEQFSWEAAAHGTFEAYERAMRS